jgi:hypothetical protein
MSRTEARHQRNNRGRLEWKNIVAARRDSSKVWPQTDEVLASVLDSQQGVMSEKNPPQSNNRKVH